MPLKLLFKKMGASFLLIWTGSTISMAGSMIVGFALSVWVFQQTGSALNFSGMIVASAIPSAIILPFAGNFADHYDRRYVMIISDTAVAVLTVFLAIYIWQDALEIWHLYLFNFLASTAGSFQQPAFQAVASASLPKDQLMRAHGFMGISDGLLQILAPATAGLLLGIIGLYGLVVLDLTTFCIGAILIFLALPANAATRKKSDSPIFTGTVKDFFNALSYFKVHPPMMLLLVFSTAQNCLLCLASMLITPLVLANHSVLELGWILTCGGIGAIAASGFLIMRGNFKNPMMTFLISDIFLSLTIIVAGTSGSVSMYSACAFFALFIGTIGDGCVGALWMKKIPLDRQGRVFALINLLSTIFAPMVALTGGWAADRLFEPALAKGGLFIDTLASLIVLTNGRGMALVFVSCGFLSTIVSLTALMMSSIKSLEELVPDGR